MRVNVCAGACGVFLCVFTSCLLTFSRQCHPLIPSDELKGLRAEMEKQGQMAQAVQEAELLKVQGDLTKAKNEVQALRKQRDAKLAVHERQVCGCECMNSYANSQN